jgi:hypothetical protein
MRIDQVDPLAFADSASLVLREAWELPSISYSPDYLRWLFSFPGEPAVAAAAFDGREPIGFRAVLPRSLRFRGNRIDAYLSSFMSVRPAWRGPIAGILKRTLEKIAEQRRFRVAFSRPGTPGEEITKAVVSPGFRRRDFGFYRTHGHVVGSHPTASPILCSAVDDLDDFLAVIERCNDTRTLWSAPDRDHLEHYRCDPRGCILAVARAPGGEPVGAARIVHAELETTNGPERVTMLDSLFLPDPTADILRALLAFAGRCWPTPGRPTVLTAPNLWGVDEQTLRSVGLRATPSSFVGYLFTPPGADPDQLAGAEGTNLEVV